VRLAAIVTDASDDLRDWQETSLQNLLRSTRVLVGTVSHEIRNVCAAIGMVHANLGRLPGVAASPDYEALGSLAAVLAKVATYEMASAAEVPPAAVDLRSVLEELRIILEPQLAAGKIEFSISLPAGLPLVDGDHHGLLQVFLNLTRNSLRALESAPVRALTVQAEFTPADVLIRLRDTGPGIAHPERVFRAFQPGAESSGLGLYVARAIIRSAGGELYHEPTSSGCTMCIQLRPFSHNQEDGELDFARVDPTL
jgi:signal transduction histidine kinase